MTLRDKYLAELEKRNDDQNYIHIRKAYNFISIGPTKPKNQVNQNNLDSISDREILQQNQFNNLESKTPSLKINKNLTNIEHIGQANANSNFRKSNTIGVNELPNSKQNTVLIPNSEPPQIETTIEPNFIISNTSIENPDQLMNVNRNPPFLGTGSRNKNLYSITTQKKRDKLKIFISRTKQSIHSHSHSLDNVGRFKFKEKFGKTESNVDKR
ncbi:hypothetical protein KGF54_002568 [Candida jiufengensis]|uniref:uncharacterized protein n=1 Tax=Candida jiufengensis TaxID=497108 RepID=UPI0022254514|nr:uncharacterized protein KGF54_002568 [Candida jiufengensis]KAI5953197.1 hypothetical protein KGF54_002568 [Candida jiufengensis]